MCFRALEQLPPQAVSELLVLSDELNINERVCVELWSQVTLPSDDVFDAWQGLMLFCDQRLY